MQIKPSFVSGIIINVEDGIVQVSQGSDVQSLLPDLMSPTVRWLSYTFQCLLDPRRPTGETGSGKET